MNLDTLELRLHTIAKETLKNRAPAHDYLHVCRVAKLARNIALNEGASIEIVTAAALLHEQINLPKNHPEAFRSGDVCAEEVSKLLFCEGVSKSFIKDVYDCVRDHAYSKGELPHSLEARILQDADRLDAIGAIGIARCFATCGELNRNFYHEDDPFCVSRTPNDSTWGVDHFFQKLLKIEHILHTKTAQDLSKKRTEIMHQFLQSFHDEISM